MPINHNPNPTRAERATYLRNTAAMLRIEAATLDKQADDLEGVAEHEDTFAAFARAIGDPY